MGLSRPLFVFFLFSLGTLIKITNDKCGRDDWKQEIDGRACHVFVLIL